MSMTLKTITSLQNGLSAMLAKGLRTYAPFHSKTRAASSSFLSSPEMVGEMKVSLDLRLGNCIDIMRSLPESSVDAIVTDPPYGETSFKWDKWVKCWPSEVARVLRPTGSMWVFGTFRMFTTHWGDFSEWKLAQDVIWEKHNGSGFHSDRFRRVHEQAVQFYQGSWGDVYKGTVVTMDAVKRSVSRSRAPAHMHGERKATHYQSKEGGPRIMRSVIKARSQHGSAIHPTQKPEAIIEPLILNACPADGIVLDPFAGSGTTGYVARRMGRKAILIEANPTYFDAMKERLSGDLFGIAS